MGRDWGRRGQDSTSTRAEPKGVRGAPAREDLGGRAAQPEPGAACAPEAIGRWVGPGQRPMRSPAGGGEQEMVASWTSQRAAGAAKGLGKKCVWRALGSEGGRGRAPQGGQESEGGGDICCFWRGRGLREGMPGSRLGCQRGAAPGTPCGPSSDRRALGEPQVPTSGDAGRRRA